MKYIILKGNFNQNIYLIPLNMSVVIARQRSEASHSRDSRLALTYLHIAHSLTHTSRALTLIRVRITKDADTQYAIRIHLSERRAVAVRVRVRRTSYVIRRPSQQQYEHVLSTVYCIVQWCVQGRVACPMRHDRAPQPHTRTRAAGDATQPDKSYQPKTDIYTHN